MEHPSTFYRLEVAPLLPVPLHRSALFSYRFRRSLPPGTLVWIPFGKQKLRGVVFESASFPGQTPPWMKDIFSVSRERSLTPRQLSLARYVAREYFAPLGNVLKHFFPPSSGSGQAPQISTEIKKKRLRPTRKESSLLQSFSKVPRHQTAFLDTSDTDDPDHLLALCVRTAYASRKQCLVLVPEIILLPPLRTALEIYFPSRTIAVLHSQLSDGTYAAEWQRIRTGDARIILATRNGLFAPYRHLGLVIVTEEQDESYKQWDMSPRYDTRRVARELARSFSAAFLCLSSTPRCDTLADSRAGYLAPLTPLYPSSIPLAPLTLVNLKLERYKKNFSPISETLREEIRNALSSGRTALLYIHRQGSSAFSVCERCRSLFRCVRCDRPLSGDEDGHFHCHHCGYKTKLFPGCPQCGHLSFRSFGFGTKRVERETARLFPSARIQRVDSETMKKAGAAENLCRRLQRQDIDILIGTQMLLRDPFLLKCSLVAMIDADSLLAFTDFRADERLLQHVFRARRALSRQHTGFGSVLLQTFHPESTFFQALQGERLGDLVEKMLRERKTLLYPPASRLIIIACRGRSETAANASASQLFHRLKQAIGHLPDKHTYRLELPFPPARLKRTNFFQIGIVLRLPPYSPLPDTVRTLLTQEPRCIIDVDPLSLILSP